MAYIFDPIQNTFIDDEDTSLGNKLQLNEVLMADATTEMDQAPDSFLRPKRFDIIEGKELPAETLEDFDVAFRKPNAKGGRVNLNTGSGLPSDYPLSDIDNKLNEVINAFKKLPSRSQERIGFQRFFEIYAKENFATGGRVNLQAGTNVMTLNPVFPERGTDIMSDEPKLLDVPGGIAFPAGLTLGGMKLKDIFFNKDESKEEIVDRIKKIEKDKKDPNQEPPKLPDDKLEKFLIKEAVDRLKEKEMDKKKRDDRTVLARDLGLAVTRSGLYEIRKDENYFNNRLQTLKDKDVNFDGYYSTREIANLLGIKTNSGVEDFVKRKNVPSVKEGLFKVIKLNDFLDAYQPTKERIQAAPELDVRTKARDNFISEIGGNFYQKFKDLRKPKELPTEVKQIYDKYNLTQIEGGHPFPVEFFTKKYGKGNTLQKDRQFDWIYRNKNKLFDKNNLVFQSKDVNTLFRNSINQLKEQYEILSPLVDKYEGKGAVKNKKDAATIEAANNKIMDIIAESEMDAKKFIEDSPNSVDLPRMRQGGLHGALFNTDTGEVSVYTGAGEGAGFVSGAAGDEPQDTKLKLGGDYLDIVSQVIADEGDKKIFTDFIEKKLLPRFNKGGPVEITPMPRVDFNGGGAAGADDTFAKELEFYFLNPETELPKAQTYKETMNPIELVNDIIDPRNIPYYADVLLRSGIRVGEFAGRLLPALGELASDLMTKPAFKVTGGGNYYVRDYDEIPPTNIEGQGLFMNFLKNITPTGIEKASGLAELIEKEEQKQKDRRSTVGPKILADTVGLGIEVAAPIFPGVKLLKAYAKDRGLPKDNVTKDLLEKEVDEVLSSKGMNRREFLQMTGAGATVAMAKLLGIGGDVAAPVAPVAKVPFESATRSEAPTYFFDLASKIKLLGKQSKIGPAERINEYSYTGKNGDEYTLTEDITTGDMQITKDKIGGRSYEEGSYDVIEDRTVMDYKAAKQDVDVEAQKGVSEAAEYEEYKVEFDQDGTEAGADAIDEIIQKEIIEESSLTKK